MRVIKAHEAFLPHWETLGCTALEVFANTLPNSDKLESLHITGNLRPCESSAKHGVSKKSIQPLYFHQNLKRSAVNSNSVPSRNP
jgi:hypothetical protein